MDECVLHLSLPVSDLAAARRFYEDGLGCRVGRVRDEWLDVWFFGMQLTLQHRPDEVLPADVQDARHFGVAVPTVSAFDSLIVRLRSFGVEWLTEPSTASAPELNGKLSAKLADPSGNVIEIKHYDDTSRVQPQ